MALEEWEVEVTSTLRDDDAVDRHRAIEGVLRNDALTVFVVALAESIVALAATFAGPR